MREAARSTTVVWVTVGIGVALAGAVFLIRLAAGDLPLPTELAGALLLGAVAAAPPTLAVLGITGRPGLLLSAGICAVISAPFLSIFWLIEVVLGIVWLVTYARTPGRGSAARTVVAAIVIPVLWVAAGSLLFVHLDPRCAQTLEDGTVREFDGAANGFESGWVWNAGSEISGSSGVSVDVVEEVCTSDVVTWPEALAGLALLAALFGVGWTLVEPAEDQAG